MKMFEFERKTLKSELFANPARGEIGFSVAPIDLAVFQDREVEGETVIVPGLAAAGVGDDLAGLREALRKNLVLFGVVPIGRDDLDLDAAFLALGDELSAQFRNVRMQVNLISDLIRGLAIRAVIIPSSANIHADIMINVAALVHGFFS